MVKCIVAVMVVLSLFGGNMKIGVDKDLVGSIADMFQSASAVVVTIDGVDTQYDKSSKKFTDILSALMGICKGGYEMPAFGVSLHDDTVKERETGVWVELKFDDTLTHNEMPFSALLIKVVPDFQGFNIVRFNDGKYAGRCFYMALDGDMSALYTILTK